MTSILSVATALPEFQYTPHEVGAVADAWLGKDTKERKLFERFVTSSRAEGRHFVLPSDQMMSLDGLEQRTELFERFGPNLGSSALHAALSQSGTAPSQIATLLYTSCSCPAIPAIDALILEQTNLPRTTKRIPIFQHGCAGGVIGLGLAADMAATGKTVALTSVELCSLIFQAHSATPAQLVGSAIFADGAAAAIISPENHGLTFIAHQSYLIPDSRHLMGYNLLDNGFHLRLDRELPSTLAHVAPEQVRNFLAQHGVTTNDIAYWLFHPGGVKILDFLETAFSLRPEQACWSREILRTVGNLSSATVLFVMRAFLDAKVVKPGEKVVMLGIGPGLTLELILFEYRE